MFLGSASPSRIPPPRWSWIFPYGADLHAPRRELEYERPAKGGGTTVQEGRRGACTLPDGPGHESPEVNREIIGIIGLTAASLLQIAMIAYGISLLLADQEPPGDLLEIFQTRYHIAFQERMKQSGGGRAPARLQPPAQRQQYIIGRGSLSEGPGPPLPRPPAGPGGRAVL